MIIQDVVPQIITSIAVGDLLMIVFMMIVDEDLPTETIMINVSLVRMKSFDHEGIMMMMMIVEKKEREIEQGILQTKAENRRKTMSLEIQTALMIIKMKEIANAGGVEARVGVKERGRRKDPEIRAGTRIERKATDAATVTMTGVIAKKRIEMIRSLIGGKMTKVEESGSARKIQTEIVVENATNVAGMTRILVVVTRLAMKIVREKDRIEMTEEAMAEVVIGIGLHRHQEGSTISMEILLRQIEIEVVKEIEINAMMGDTDLALKIGDLRWVETAVLGMGLIGDHPWEEMVIQMIDAGTRIEEDNHYRLQNIIYTH